MKGTDTIYISKASCISPQPTFTADTFFASWPTLRQEQKLTAVDPDYKALITDSGKRRRMGHLIKMGVSTSLASLEESDKRLLPDALMSATGMGGLDDTEKFLRCIIDNDETLLNPANFIQSTGNTFGGQTGLLLGHHGYNVTYAHGGYSMESALIDATMQLKDGSIGSALVTGADEITETEYEAMRKMGFWRNGRQMGEGSHSFLLTGNAKNSLCQLANTKTYRGIEGNARMVLETFLAESNLQPNDCDLVVTGCDCDYESIRQLTDLPTLDYKQWCGQYATASGFGLWLAAELLNRGIAPEVNSWKNQQLRNIVVYSEYRKNDYSLVLVRK